MTHKDYKLIASRFRLFNTIDLSERHPNDAIRELTIAVAIALHEENPQFNRHKFLEACGL
jgi:hypothetical protein